MALYGTGSASQIWRSPPRDMPAQGGRPIWISLWLRSPNVTGAAGLAAFQYSGGGSASAGPYTSGAVVSGWDQNDGGSGIDTFTSSALLTNTWQHILAYYPSASSRAVYVGGSVVGSNSTVATPTQTMNVMAVGTVRTTPALVTRALGDVTFGNGVLSGEQIKALAAGRNPLVVVPSQILGYYPLRGTLEDLGPRHAGLQPIGGPATIWTDHPLVDPPPRRRLFLIPAAAGGTARPLTPAGTAATTQAATLGRTRKLGATLQNLIHNSTMQGAAAGSPGTLPTTWSASMKAGIGWQIVGTGTDSGGLPYIDLRIFGTSTASGISQILLDGVTACAFSQRFSWGVYSQLIAGSTTGFVSGLLQWSIQGYGADGVTPTAPTTTILSATGTRTRSVGTNSINSSTYFVAPYLGFQVNSGNSVDVTMRVSGPQLEPTQSSSNPYLPTSGSAYSSPYLATAASDQSATVSHLLTSAAATASTTQTATLGRQRALTAAGTAATSQTASARALRALTPAATASTSQAATLGRTRALAAAGAATTAQTAAVGRARPVTATGTATTSQAGTVHALRALACAGTAATGQTAALARSRRLTAAGTATTTQTSPSLGRFGTGQLSASGTAGTGQTATLHAIRALVATGLAVSSQAASSARSRAASPTAGSAVSSQSAQLGRRRPLAPLGATAGTGQAGAQRAARALRAAGVGATTQGAVMGRLRPLLAAGTAISTQSGGISASGLPIGDVPASHTILIPLDTRTVLVPLDTRTILIPR